jgi:hypothetical protein
VDGRPQLLLIAALAAVGALVVLGELVAQLDRIRMATVTHDELDRLPTTEAEDE